MSGIFCGMIRGNRHGRITVSPLPDGHLQEKGGQPVMAKKRVKFHERGVHDDIKYSGPLSFQTFQILGWSCIVITVSWR